MATKGGRKSTLLRSWYWMKHLDELQMNKQTTIYFIFSFICIEVKKWKNVGVGAVCVILTWPLHKAPQQILGDQVFFPRGPLLQLVVIKTSVSWQILYVFPVIQQTEKHVNTFICELFKEDWNLLGIRCFVGGGTSGSISVPAVKWSHCTPCLFEHGIFFLGFFQCFRMPVPSHAFSYALYISTKSCTGCFCPCPQSPSGTSPCHGGSCSHCLPAALSWVPCLSPHQAVLPCPSASINPASAVTGFQLLPLSVSPWFVLSQMWFSLPIFSAACSCCAGTRSSGILGVTTSWALALLPAGLGRRQRENPAQPLLSQAGDHSVHMVF